MTITFAKTRPALIPAISLEIVFVGLFSLLGLTLSAVVLTNVSPETISIMF